MNDGFDLDLGRPCFFFNGVDRIFSISCVVIHDHIYLALVPCFSQYKRPGDTCNVLVRS